MLQGILSFHNIPKSLTGFPFNDKLDNEKKWRIFPQSKGVQETLKHSRGFSIKNYVNRSTFAIENCLNGWTFLLPPWTFLVLFICTYFGCNNIEHIYRKLEYIFFWYMCGNLLSCFHLILYAVFIYFQLLFLLFFFSIVLLPSL